MKFDAAATSEVGHVREANEDAYLCGSTVFAVADGLGGHAAGEVASALGIAAVKGLDGQRFETPGAASEALSRAIREANRAVLDAALADPAREGMGTTITAATAVDDQLVLAHVGDSRAYLARPGEALRRLTDDHTVVGEAVRHGLLDADDVRHHPHRNVLTRAVGLEDELEVDRPAPVRLRAGDRVLLCSDGLTEPVGEDAIGALLASAQDPQGACRALVRSALDGGGPDNITVVVVFLAA